MDKLGIETGGKPEYNDEILFLQDSVRESLSGVAKALGTDSILQGCVYSEPSGNTWQVTEGFVVIGGEIFYSPAASGTWAGPEPLVWTIPEAYKSFDPLTYADSNEHNNHEVRRAVPVPTSLAGGAGVADYATTLITRYNDTWHSFDLNTNWSGIGGAAYIKEGNWVSFRGAVLFTSAGVLPNTPFATLPFVYRPANDGFFPCVYVDTFTDGVIDNPGNGWIYIQTNGNCYVDSREVDTLKGKTAFLNGVRFKV